MLANILHTISYSLTKVGLRVTTKDNRFYDIPVQTLILTDGIWRVLNNLPNYQLKEIDGKLMTEDEFKGNVRVEAFPPYQLVKEVQIYLNRHDVDLKQKEPFFGTGGFITQMKNDAYDLKEGNFYWRRHERAYKNYYREEKAKQRKSN